ncbi:hypothetical protein RI367_007831 [Sorochytrium milnesiophthora]
MLLLLPLLASLLCATLALPPAGQPADLKDKVHWKTAARILSSLNQSASPCHNFYEYSCGGWLKKHSNTEEIGTLQHTVHDSYTPWLRDVLESKDQRFEPTSSSDREILGKLRDSYASCMDAKGAASLGMAHLRQLLDKTMVNITGHDAATVLNNPSWYGRTVPGILSQIALKLAVSPFVKLDIVFERKRLEYVAVLQADPETVVMNLDTDAEHIERTFRSVFPDVNGSQIVDCKWMAAKVTQMALKLQEADNATKQEPRFLGYRANETESMLPFVLPGLPLASYVRERLRAAGVQLNLADLDQRILVTTYIERLSSLLYFKEGRAVTYLLWKAIQKWEAMAQGEWESPPGMPLWKQCIGYVNGLMPYAALRQVVRAQRFTSADQAAIREMLTGIQENLQARIKAAEWLDTQDRARMGNKVAVIKHRIGLLEVLGDADKVAQLYSDLQIDRHMFFNTVALFNRRLADADKLVKGGGAALLSKGLDEPIHYRAWDSTIVVPPDTVAWPLFHIHQPHYVNYAALGTALGFTLSTSVTIKGVGFDEHGRRFNMSSSSKKTYADRARCFVDQYKNFTLPQVGGPALALDVYRTPNGNMGDNLGLRLAWTVWQEKRSAGDDILPALSRFSPEQLFFINVGQMHCSKLSSKTAKQVWTEDDHPFEHSRVHGMVQNMPEFASAFNCAPGTPMNPVHKCQFL